MSEDKKKAEFKLELGKKRSGLASEFLAFLASNKKWWLLPILVVFLLLGAFLLLSSTGLAPLIYPLF